MAAVVVGGADPSVRPPCFTNDRQTVLVCYGPDVRGFSAASGQPKLTFRGHAAAVTAVVLHPGRPEIALTSSLDGTGETARRGAPFGGPAPWQRITA